MYQLSQPEDQSNGAQRREDPGANSSVDGMQGLGGQVFISPYHEVEDDNAQNYSVIPNVPVVLHSGDPFTDTAGYEEPSTSQSQIGEPRTGHRQEQTFGKPSGMESILSLPEGSQEAKKSFPCSECGKCYSKKAKLKIHQRTHTGEKPYSCLECGKCFSVKATLLDHIKIHSGEKPYSCTKCPKRFSQRSTFMDHMKLHTGMRPFSCHECGKGFHRKARLLEHARTHTKEKPFSCPECEKSFNWKANLEAHLRTHQGLKSYFCSECGKWYRHGSSLTRHQKTHRRESETCLLPEISRESVACEVPSSSFTTTSAIHPVYDQAPSRDSL